MREQIKRDHRKALPKYILELLCAGIFGFIMGLGGSLADHFGVAEAASAALAMLFHAVAPWSIPVTSLVLLVPGWWLYFAAKGGYRRWDGEEEGPINQAEARLSWALLFSAMTLVLDMFFFSAATVYAPGSVAPVIVGELIVSCVVLILLQQKVVDLDKTINPEKRGSIYDPRFHETWMASCDEAEQRQITQAAYKAYRICVKTCLALWVALFILNIAFSIGLLPMAVVLVIFGVLQVTYALECIRMQKMQKREIQ